MPVYKRKDSKNWWYKFTLCGGEIRESRGRQKSK